MTCELILDGGLSTQLQAQGIDIDDRLWTARTLLDDPQAIEQAHGAFVDAGADVIITASYQISRAGFAASGLAPEGADEAISASIAVARRAAGDRALVAASIGPFGAISHDGAEYRGNYGIDRADLVAFHRSRIVIAEQMAPDWIAVETIPDIEEVHALAVALRGVSTPTWMSFSCADARSTCAGQPIEQAAAAAAAIDCVSAIGVNCTDPSVVRELIHRIADSVELPILVYPNAGGVWNASTGMWEQVSTIDMVDSARGWIDAGASWIGGCCGTDADAIAALATLRA